VTAFALEYRKRGRR